MQSRRKCFGISEFAQCLLRDRPSNDVFNNAPLPHREVGRLLILSDALGHSYIHGNEVGLQEMKAGLQEMKVGLQGNEGRLEGSKGRPKGYDEHLKNYKEAFTTATIKY